MLNAVQVHSVILHCGYVKLAHYIIAKNVKHLKFVLNVIRNNFEIIYFFL